MKCVSISSHLNLNVKLILIDPGDPVQWVNALGKKTGTIVVQRILIVGNMQNEFPIMLCSYSASFAQAYFVAEYLGSREWQK